MRGFEKHLEEFQQRDVELVAVSVDPPETTREHTRRMGFSFRFLCDPEAKVIRQLDLLHPGASMEGTDIARPAEFLLDPTGTVRWLNLTDNWRIRPRPQDVLEVVKQIQSRPPGE